MSTVYKHSNTHPTNTETTVPAIDWMRITFSESPGILLRIKDVLGNSGWESRISPHARYALISERGKIQIQHDRSGSSACLYLTGQGCRELEHQLDLDESGWQSLLSQLLAMGGTVQRIDWAFDDAGQVLDIDRLADAVKDGTCVTRLQTPIKITALDANEHSEKTTALAFGSRKKQYYLRIYERPLLNSSTGETYIRVEIESKYQAAHAATHAFIAGGFTAVLGDLDLRLSFRHQTEDTNKSRWPRDPDWQRFIGSEFITRIDRDAGTERTLSDAAECLERQHGVFLYLLLESPEFGSAWLEQLKERCRPRLRGKHLRMAGLISTTGCLPSQKKIV